MEEEKMLGIDYVPLLEDNLKKVLRIPEKLLREPDVISLQLAFTEQTKGILGEKEIATMKDGAFLINTARGAGR